MTRQTIPCPAQAGNCKGSSPVGRPNIGRRPHKPQSKEDLPSHAADASLPTKPEAALGHARRRLRGFPLIPDAPPPLIANWQDVAATDESVVRKWWETSPDANIGWFTGDLLVIDLDLRNGGTESWNALALVEEFPKTLWH